VVSGAGDLAVADVEAFQVFRPTGNIQWVHACPGRVLGASAFSPFTHDSSAASSQHLHQVGKATKREWRLKYILNSRTEPQFDFSWMLRKILIFAIFSEKQTVFDWLAIFFPKNRRFLIGWVVRVSISEWLAKSFSEATYGVRALSRQIVYLNLNRESLSLREHGNSRGTLNVQATFIISRKKFVALLSWGNGRTRRTTWKKQKKSSNTTEEPLEWQR
jgi:hypothetical protein